MIFFEECNLFFWDDLLLGVTLVDEDVKFATIGVHSGFLQPKTLHIFEAFGVGDIIDKNDSLCSLVVGLGDASEPLLSSSVPDLQLCIAFIDYHGSASEVNYLNLKSIPMVEM